MNVKVKIVKYWFTLYSQISQGCLLSTSTWPSFRVDVSNVRRNNSYEWIQTFQTLFHMLLEVMNRFIFNVERQLIGYSIASSVIRRWEKNLSGLSHVFRLKVPIFFYIAVKMDSIQLSFFITMFPFSRM